MKTTCDHTFVWRVRRRRRLIGSHAQGRGGSEWTTGGYDAQRTASIRTDPRISRPGDAEAG